MIQRGLSPFASGSFYNMRDFLVPPEVHYVPQGHDELRSAHSSFEEHISAHSSFEGHISAHSSFEEHTSAHSSFEEHISASSPEEYVLTPASSIAELDFNPWLLEASPEASTVSRSSSRSGSDYISTTPEFVHPPPYIGPGPVYHPISYTVPQVTDYMVQHPSYINNPEHTWQWQYHNGNIDSSQASSHLWNGGGSYELPSPPTVKYYVPSYMANAPSSSGPSTEIYRAARQPSDSAPFKFEKDGGSSNGNGSGTDDSDDENDDSSYNHRKDSCSSSVSKTKDATSASILKLGKWSMAVDSLTHPEARHYQCPFANQPPGDGGRVCDQSFVRPEHLRRHVKTVHGDVRPYICKVPKCHREFSRGDNLREHYWTHLHWGGRAGKNVKMSLLELKAILGPKEKTLMKRLQKRLAMKQNNKQLKCKL